MTIPDFEMWQQSECDQLGITVKEHNQVLEILNKMSSGRSNNYDTFTNAINLTTLESFSVIIQGVNNERKES